MRSRLVVTAVLCAIVSVVPTWLSLQPLFRRGDGARSQEASLLLLGLDLGLATLVSAVVLHFVIGRPVRRIDGTVRSLARPDDEDGEVLIRIDRALRRLALDLSEERRINQSRLDALTASRDSLARLQAELVANDRLATVGKLAAGVAHEVGNPLAGILGYLSVVRMRAGGNAELLDLVGRIEAEVQRIDGIVRSLLELGRPSRGKADSLAVKPIVESVSRLLLASEDFRGVSLLDEIPATLWARAEPGPLSQVLVNLVINAAQAMGKTGRVTLRAETIDNRVHVHVDDEGPGLSEAVLARLFEPFFTTREAGKGTGLGLAVSRQMLSQFDATLSAANRPQGGARFTISLPAP